MKTLEEVRQEKIEDGSSLSAMKSIRDSLDNVEKIDLSDLLEQYEKIIEAAEGENK